jgi:hypothetical protein
MHPDPVIAGSARKHGVRDDEILHAFRNPVRVFSLDEGFTMVIGAGRTGTLYEVGVVEGHTALVVVHAMKAREKFVRW